MPGCPPRAPFCSTCTQILMFGMPGRPPKMRLCSTCIEYSCFGMISDGAVGPTCIDRSLIMNRVPITSTWSGVGGMGETYIHRLQLATSRVRWVDSNHLHSFFNPLTHCTVGVVVLLVIIVVVVWHHLKSRYRYTDMLLFRYTDIPISRYPEIPISRYPDISGW